MRRLGSFLGRHLDVFLTIAIVAAVVLSVLTFARQVRIDNERELRAQSAMCLVLERLDAIARINRDNLIEHREADRVYFRLLLETHGLPVPPESPIPNVEVSGSPVCVEAVSR